ncbi:glycosyltransferase family 4 protein [Bacillus sp. RO3]|nr:glycosyltransferase family 4 protein [Bacillus sp. RO3]
MRILKLITRMDDIGGAQIHVQDLSLSLKRSGHEVIILSRGTGPVTDVLQEQGIRCEQLIHLNLAISPFHDLLALMELCKWIKEIDPDILAAHSSKAGMLGRLAGKICGVPTVFTAHGWAFSEGVPESKRKVYRLLERCAGFISNGIITVSDYDYDLACKNKIINGAKMRTIHNGVPDIPDSNRRKNQRSPLRIIMVARFAFPKEQPLLLQALENIEEPDWELDLVGDGPRLNELKEKVQRSSLSHRIHFLGNRRDVPELLANAHIFVLTSQYEGLPISIIEAMRCGLPIVASDVGGVEELVKEGENGFLIPRGDATLLTSKLKTLMANQPLMEKMGQVSRQRYEAKFSFEKMRDQTLQMYRDILESQAQSPKVLLPEKKREV